jgi:hypothetical protein
MHPLIESSIAEIDKEREELSPKSAVTTNGKNPTTPRWSDPDTMNNMRIRGMNAPEVGHIRKGIFVPGAYQGISEFGPKAAEIAGFSDVRPAGKDPSYPTRQIGDLVNPRTQEVYGDFATKTGLSEPTPFSSPEVMSSRRAINAFSSMYPEESKQDPVLAKVQDARKVEEQLLRQQRTPQYIPKINVGSEAEYAQFKSSVGVGAQARIEKEIALLEKDLAEGKYPFDVRPQKEKELNDARQSLMVAGMTPDIVGGVWSRADDRTIMNEAYNQKTTALKNAGLEVLKGLGGIDQMAGEAMQWDWLTKRAALGVERIKLDQAALPTTLSSYRDIRTHQGALTTASDTATYVGNLFAGTLPQMAVTVAATIATGGAGLLAGAISTLPASALYAGQYYADQPDDKKNASLAIFTGLGSGAADRIGMGTLLGGKNILTREGKEAAITALMKPDVNNITRAATRAEAVAIIDNATKAEILSFVGTGKEFAKQQAFSPEAFLRNTGAGVGKMAVEGGTEGLQQYLQMAGQSGEWNRNFEYQRGFKDQLIDAVVGGAVMGHTMHVPGQFMDFAQWHSLYDDKKLYEKSLGEAQMFQADNQRMKQQGGGFDTIQDVSRAVVNDSRYDTKLDMNTIPTHKGFFNGMKEIISDPGRTLRQLGHTTVASIVNEDGTFKRNLAYVKAIMGGYGILPGDHAQGFEQRTLGKWATDSKDALAAKMNIATSDVDHLVKSAWQNYWSQGQKLPKDINPELQLWKDEMDKTHALIVKEMRAAGIPVGHLADENALFNQYKVDPMKIVANRDQIIDEVMNSSVDPSTGEVMADRDEVTKAVNNLLSTNKQKASNAKDYLNKFNLFSNPNLSHVFEPSILDSINHMKESLARKLALKTFVGENGEVLARLLDMAYKSGEFGTVGSDHAQEAFKDTATEAKRWYDLMNGTYGTEFRDNYPKLDTAATWLNTALMLSSLSKAAISSQTEATLATAGTPAAKVPEQLGNYFKEFKAEIGSDLNRFSAFSASMLGISRMRMIPDVKLQNKLNAMNKELERQDISDKEFFEIADEVEALTKRLTNRGLFHRLGFSEVGFDAAAKFEYSSTTVLRKVMEVYASAIALRAQTDANRMAILSVGADILSNHLAVLSTVPPEKRISAFSSGRGLSKEQAYGLMELQKYGLDVYNALTILDSFPGENLFSDTRLESEETGKFQDQLFTALGNFVDSRAVNPQFHNTPVYFNDPRLKVLTVMGKFMATAHAVLLPRLYRDYIVNGGASMRYQAFSAMGMTILAGFLLNMLKDQVSYGDDSPYVKSKLKKTQRALNSSGLLGRYETVLNTISPVIPVNGPAFKDSPGGWAWDKVTNVAPSIAWADRAGSGIANIATGNTEKGVKQLVRSAPLVGSFPIAASTIASAFKQER